MKLKKLLAILMAAVLVCSVAACGAKEPSANTEPAAGTQNTEPQPGDVQSGSQTDPGASQPAGDTRRGGVLKLAIGAVIYDLGVPANGLSFDGAFIADTAIEHLCRYNPDGTLQPWLCTAYEVDADAQTLTVHLREGVKFHDGSDFNAEAVVWNWNLFTEKGNAELSCVDNYEIVDDHTIVVHLATWSNSIDISCLYTAGQMISKEYAETNGLDAANKNPCGTGPFKCVAWNVDESVIFEANDDYWIEGLPYLDGVEFYLITDPATQTSAFLSNEVDVLVNAGADASMTLKGNGFTPVSKPMISGTASTIFWFGCQSDGPVGNVDARRAICSAIDMDAIWAYCSSQTGAIYDRTIQWGPNNVWSVNPETKGYPYDVNAAKEYLKAAGYPDGFDMTIYYEPVNKEAESVATLAADYLKEAGINAALEGIETSVMNDISGMNGTPVNGMVFSAGRAEVDLTVYYNRTFLPDGVRWVNQVNHEQKVVDTINSAMSCKTFEEKQKLCQELSRMVIDDYCELFPMWTSSNAAFTHGDLEDHGIYQINLIIWNPETAHFTK